MSTSLVSSQPVAIPSDEVPEGFRLPEGSDRRVIKAGEASVACSLCLSSLSFCVRKCGGGDAVSIEAWFPWDGAQPEGCHCYLTRKALEALGEPRPGGEPPGSGATCQSQGEGQQGSKRQPGFVGDA